MSRSDAVKFVFFHTIFDEVWLLTVGIYPTKLVSCIIMQRRVDVRVHYGSHATVAIFLGREKK